MVGLYLLSFPDHFANANTKDHTTFQGTCHMAGGIGRIVLHGYQWTFPMPVSMDRFSFLPGMWIRSFDA
jgi:hypothetical protein